MGKKIFLISDSPFATTGLGRMTKYFLKMFPGHKWYIWGGAHPEHLVRGKRALPSYDADAFEANFELFSPMTFGDDQYNFQALAQVLQNVLETDGIDYVITSMDFDRTFGLLAKLKELRFQYGFKWINYFPADRTEYFERELEAFKYPDHNICITEYGVKTFKAMNERIKMDFIHHPIDAEEFPEVSKKKTNEFKKKFYGFDTKNKKIIGSVGRSFFRKDPLALIDATVDVMSGREDVIAYLHGKQKTLEGVDLREYALVRGVKPGTLSFMNPNMSEVDGVPQEILNKMYSTFDIYATASMGEGFGFPVVEALLKGIPVIASNQTSHPELVGDAGVLIEPAGEVCLYQKSFNKWKYVDSGDLSEGIKAVLDNYDEFKHKAENRSLWIKQNLSLDTIKKKWQKILV